MEAARAPGTIAVANAPVSYGAFEVTVGHDPNVPNGTEVLDQVAEAGYAGIDLGPVGYLGSGERLGGLLAERGLGLDADAWRRFATGLARAVGHCRDRGYEPTFH